jgi:DNA-binding transcriptional ArsR family regulator
MSNSSDEQFANVAVTDDVVNADTEFEPATYQDLTTLEQIRVLADPLRTALRTFLAGREYTVPELAALVDVPPRKLYYHVNELERVGLIRVVRSEMRGHLLTKYYRAVGKITTVPSSTLHGDPENPLTEEMLDHYVNHVEHVAALMRHVLAHYPPDLPPDLVTSPRRYFSIAPEHATTFVERLEAMAQALMEEYELQEERDDAVNLLWMTITVPTEHHIYIPEERNE